GGRGEKRTLRAAARFADGWNAPYIGPDEWIHKGKVLDQWCETEKRDPRTILKTVNLGFYLGADAKGAARGEQVFQSHFGKDPRDGFLRGTPKETLAMLTRFRDAGCVRVNIAFREGPYDWDALHAFAETVFRVFAIRPPTYRARPLNCARPTGARRFEDNERIAVVLSAACLPLVVATP